MHNTAIGASMRNQYKQDKVMKRLLLLGTGSSGKSTLFKSLQCIQNQGVDDSKLRESTHVIRQNLVSGMLTLLKKSQDLYEKNPEKHGICQVNLDDDTLSLIQFIVLWDGVTFNEDNEELEYDKMGELANAINELWKLDAIQATFQRRGGNFSFPDNMDYFFDKCTDILQQSYFPTFEDMLKARVMTTGAVPYEYNVDDHRFYVFDVGGQRNERKKWIHQFENITAVLFVIALNHYHDVLFEDENINAMHEAVNLFDQICNSKWFRKSEMILFLNKSDLFKLKIRDQVSLSVCFSKNVGWNGTEWNGPDYLHSDDKEVDDQLFRECFEAAIAFIKQVFDDKNQVKARGIYKHVSCATDQDSVKQVFWDVQNIVIRSNLKRGGLLM